MAIQRPLRLGAVRRNSLAACLAAALATGGAVAGTASHVDRPAGQVPALSASFDATHSRTNHLKPKRQAGDWMRKLVPARPAAPNVVQTCEDNVPGSLRDAVANAGEGDLIDLSALTCSTITLDGGAIAVTVPSLLIQGPGQHRLTIDGAHAGLVFEADYALAIADLTVAHGKTTSGFGGCIKAFEKLTLTRSTVTDCEAGDGVNGASYGGGVDVIGDLILQASSISGSTARAANVVYGGGAYVFGIAHIDGSDIAGNSATATSGEARGGGLLATGAIYVDGSRIRDNEISSTDGTVFGGGIYSGTFIGSNFSTISGNIAHSANASSYGGGVHSRSVDDYESVFASSTVSGNSAVSDCQDCLAMGGGVSGFGKVTVLYSVFYANAASALPESAANAAGGGIATKSPGVAGALIVVQSTISGNSASGGVDGSGYGGGIAAIESSPFGTVNSTIAFNHASHFGGGATGTVASQMLSSIVANNDAADDPDLAPGSLVTSLDIIGGNNFVGVSSDTVGLPADTLYGDPGLVANLAQNGGLTKTHALAMNSQALDTGSNVANLPNDQRHCPFARVSGAAADIGAYELQVITPDSVFGHGFDAYPPSCH